MTHSEYQALVSPCVWITSGSPLWRDLTNVISILYYSTPRQTCLGRESNPGCLRHRRALLQRSYSNSCSFSEPLQITYISRLRDERKRDTTFRDGQAIVCNFLLLLKFHVLTTVGISYCNIICYLEAPKNVIKGFYAGSLNLICCTCHSTKPTSLQAQKQSFIFT